MNTNTSKQSRLTVLVVDSDDQSSSFLKEDLLQDGYQPVVARTGSDAVAMLTNQVVDVAIIDRNLVDIDSIRLCEKIRTLPIEHHLSIIIVSAFGDDLERERALSSGADEYICKPFLYSALATMIGAFSR